MSNISFNHLFSFKLKSANIVYPHIERKSASSLKDTIFKHLQACQAIDIHIKHTTYFMWHILTLAKCMCDGVLRVVQSQLE